MIKRTDYINLALVLFVLILATSCNDQLVEKPSSIITPEYFKTEPGLKAGLYSAYSNLRYLYGTSAALESNVLGTDEFSNTNNVLIGGELSMDTYDNNLNPSNTVVANLWVNAFSNINTCNGLIEIGPTITFAKESDKTLLIAEAKFLRAHLYFLLVQAYGKVPLDLGSGSLKFNTSISTTSVRSSISEVYSAIIADLKDASKNLTDKPITSQPGHATKASALHFLAKAFLTRATSEAKKTTDYDSAYFYANQIINNQTIYGVGLETDFDDVNKEGNENGKEVLFNVQRTNDVSYGEITTPTGKQNFANYFFTACYENVKVNNITIVLRCIPYQRPWRMFFPTPWLIDTAFADKINDSRFEKSFRMIWKVNNPDPKLIAAGLNVGDTGIFLPGREVTSEERAAKKYVMYAPSEYLSNNQFMYPNLTKFDDVTRAVVNDPSDRPFIVAKLSETYLIAAEALIMQNRKTEALPYINAIRTRAAYRAGKDNTAAIKAITISDPNLLNLNFILDERSRELCGEQLRWTDLTRTGTLLTRVKKYNFKAAANIMDFHILRPIPQQQIDRISDPAQKANYQNYGY